MREDEDMTGMAISDIRGQLYQTAELVGLKIISDDKCCRLLAWLLVYGGGNEQIVFDGKLNAALMYAQKRLNVFGGERPNAKLVLGLQEYVKSVTDWYDPPEWVAELEAEYKIIIHREKHFGGVSGRVVAG